ncbi:MAG: hypothetical protein QNJ54_26205 [Prochloraceae cyanobacterium]|nr:hypothetical protein [Prochloraceae cyanobacterium]
MKNSQSDDSTLERSLDEGMKWAAVLALMSAGIIVIMMLLAQ